MFLHHDLPKGMSFVTRKNESGFTLIELIIGLFAASILSYAALSLYTTQHKQMLLQDEIAEMQGNLRASAEMIAKTVRMAGYNLPSPLTAIESSDTNPDTIIVTFDTGVVVGADLRFDLTSATDEIRCTTGSDVSGLSDGDWAYIYDPGSETGEFFLASQVLTGPPRIRHPTYPLSRLYPAGSLIMKVARIKYFIDDSDSTHSNLMIQPYGSQPQIFAENIENMNFRYYLSSGAIVSLPGSPQDIRLVEIDLEGRTASPDPEFFNQYRTRNFTLRVNVRNLGFGS
jgi:prepilin-type N-terminal cleavage/methylation domain-containing protein